MGTDETPAFQVIFISIPIFEYAEKNRQLVTQLSSLNLESLQCVSWSVMECHDSSDCK